MIRFDWFDLQLLGEGVGNVAVRHQSGDTPPLPLQGGPGIGQPATNHVVFEFRHGSHDIENERVFGAHPEVWLRHDRQRNPRLAKLS